MVYSNGQGTLFWLDNLAEDLVADTAATIDGIWGEVVAIRFSPSGKQAVIRYGGGKLAIWDTERWLPEHHLPLAYDPRYEAGRPTGLSDLSVAADGSVIGVQTGGGWRGWNTASGSEVAEKGKAMGPVAGASPTRMGGRSLRLSGQQVDLADGKSGRTLRLAHNDDVTSAAFSPNGACVVTTSGFMRASSGPRTGGNVARVWDAETGVLLREWQFGRPPEVAFFAGVERVVVLYRGEALVYHTPLCEDGEALTHLARDAASKTQSGPEHAAAPR